MFSNEQFGRIRTVKDNETIWFVATDVCSALGIKNPSVAMSRLDDDEKNTLALNEGNKGNPNKRVVNEYGLYMLTIGSRKKEAEQFKRWIVHDVLPSIRSTGAYITPQKIQDIILNPDTIIQFAQALKKEQEKTSYLESRVKELEYQTVKEDLTVGETAILFNSKHGVKIGKIVLFRFLRNNGLIGIDNLPFEKYVENGWFSVRRTKSYYENKDKVQFIRQTMITPKSREEILKMLKESLD